MVTAILDFLKCSLPCRQWHKQWNICKEKVFQWMEQRVLYPSRKFTTRSRIPLANQNPATAETTRIATGAGRAVQNTTKASLAMKNILRHQAQLRSSGRFVCFLVVMFCANCSSLVTAWGKTCGHSSLYNKDCIWQGTKHKQLLKGSFQTNTLLLLFSFVSFLLPWISMIFITSYPICRSQMIAFALLLIPPLRSQEVHVQNLMGTEALITDLELQFFQEALHKLTHCDQQRSGQGT